jgi:hypothetical protein
MIDYKALGAAETADGKAQNQAKAGGGEDSRAAEGPCRLRFIGYIEVGKQTHSYQGKTTQREAVRLIFEVSGPKHPPREFDGVKVPHRVVIEEWLSLSEKAHFFKLFNRMNWKGEATHMVQLLGEAYKGEIVHRKYAKRGEDKATPAKWTGVEVELFRKGIGYTIAPPQVEDIDTGELKTIPVAEAIGPMRVFMWNRPDKSQWDSLFIDGEWPAKTDAAGAVTVPARSKNVFQNTIKAASNFKGSPAYELLATNGIGLDLPESERPEVNEDAREAAEAGVKQPDALPPNDDDVLSGIAP